MVAALLGPGCAKPHEDTRLAPVVALVEKRPASPSPRSEASAGAATPPTAGPGTAVARPGSASAEPGAPLPSAAGASPSPSAADATAWFEPIFDAHGVPLPQTDERPRSDDPAFLARITLLAEAIARDDPEHARPAFFPLVAYEQVKAIRDPARDYRVRLLAAFEENVHDYHRALGSAAATARFESVEVPGTGVRFMKVGAEGNRLGYFRVLRSRLTLGTEDGRRHSFEITSMISWRGAWYVVHLHGFS